MNLIEIGKKALQTEIEALSSVKERLGPDFSRAARLVAESNKVVISGVGKSGLVGRKIAATLSSVGISSVFLHPVEALHGDIGIVQKGDVAILISKSGSTDELVKIVPYLKTLGAKIISIVGSVNSFLARASDATLDGEVAKEACPHNLAPTSSTTVALALGDALAVTAMQINNFTVEDFSRLHPLGQIGRNLTVQVKDAMHSGERTPRVAPDASLRDAIIEISMKGLGCAAITDETGALIGLITDGDLRRALEKHEDIRGLSAKDIMTYNPITIRDTAMLGEALQLMEQRERQINVLPVINSKGIAVGVIRVHDILRSGQQ
ncbi:MAG: KpsF/GutQ family sugar-phosphate isomerase [Chloroflexota bacterium]